MATSGEGVRDRPPAPSLTVAAVARRLGVAPATLRTWDRRYGLGPSEHAAGAHRRYSAQDVARLLVMRRLTLEGVAPSEAARTALAATDAPAAEIHVPTTAEVMDAYSDAVPMAADPAALVAAASQFDNAAVRWMLARVAPRDVLAWWSDLVEPTLRTVGDRAVLERPGESVHPALVAAAFAELRSRAAVAAAHVDAVDPGATVLVVPTGDGPDLRSHVLATALQAKGVQARVLSSSSPSVVTGAVERALPAALLVEVGATDTGTRVTAVVRAATAARPGIPVFVHLGNATTELPVAANVHRVRTLPGALHEVLAAV